MGEQNAKDKLGLFRSKIDGEGDLPNRYHNRIDAIDLGDIFGQKLLNWLGGFWNDIDDVKISLFGDSDLKGFGENDILVGAGFGDQKLEGGNGDDILLGVGATTYLHGGEGEDVILGLAAINEVHGAKGPDYIGVLGG